MRRPAADLQILFCWAFGARAVSGPGPGRLRGQNRGLLDMLRLVAALLLVLYHYFFLAWVELPPGGGGIRDMLENGPTYPWSVPVLGSNTN